MFTLRLLVAAAALLAVSVRTIAALEAEPRPVAVATYEVAPGDTLWGIARRVDPSGDPRAIVERLIRLNDLRSGSVHVGQSLQIPAR